MGILVTVAYDGTAYKGWQEQAVGTPTVFSVLKGAVEGVMGCQVRMLGASRTDAGVHALGQRAHILPSAPCPIPTEKLGAVLNTRLPDDIAVTAVGIVPDSFHPIADAISKTYSYKILNTPLRNPLISRYSVHETTPLLVAAMEEACQYFVGEHDFAAFCATGSPVSSTIRRVNSLELSVSGGLIDMQINGNGFLYNMVRIIAGTLVGVGMGKIRPDGICDIIASKKREKAGKTMPAHGLTLVNIFY